MKSKKHSIISPLLKQLEVAHPLFLDRDQGNKRLPTLLREAGFHVECFSVHVKDPTTDDHVWIPEFASKGWIIVSSDQGLETDPINRCAVIASKARVFILEEKNSRSIDWAAALIVSRSRLYEIVHETPGPFFVTVAKRTRSLLTVPRIPD